MSWKTLQLIRRLSTSKSYHRPALSEAYKSKNLWDERFSCELLGSDSNLIKTINNKIISGIELDNLELDVFINIAVPRVDDIAQLQEAVSSLRRFRKTIYANTLLPSTSHALCRLFLDSQKIPSLLNLLEKRVEFGIFHDPYSLNLLFDETLNEKNLALGCRLAALIMLQEEFGQSQINDNFALYSLAKYMESRTDFSDWHESVQIDHRIFKDYDPTQMDLAQDSAIDESKSQDADKKKESADEEDDEEEEDAEYIRIPFLRNPYFDNHFDLTDPRAICGKSLSMLGLAYKQSEDSETKRLGNKCKLAGHILQTNWAEAKTELEECLKLKVPTSLSISDTLKHYISFVVDDQKTPSDEQKNYLISGIDKLPKEGLSLSEEAEQRQEKLRHLEEEDIKQFKASLVDWSNKRLAVKKIKADLVERKKIIQEIAAKKEELKLKEQYLYFYDNLKRSNLTRIEYE